jgi:uncharacterized protein (DUF362 family)
LSEHTIAELENVVAIARSLQANYGELPVSVAAPELPAGAAKTAAAAAVRELFAVWGLDREHYGSAQWNPLGKFIHPGAMVVLKPNWVVDINRSGHGLDCLVTHTSVIEAVLEYVTLAMPGCVIIGDAPVQGCDLERLFQIAGVPGMLSRFKARGLNLSVADFRLTVLRGEELGATQQRSQRQMSQYVLFDLKKDSLLEPLNADAEKFRVTMYNPDLLSKTHAPGRHQYLVAREVIDADVVINLPKLKAHKKACITGALKNLVGINGHKEFLPHHRKGGELTGGDCYPGSSRLKGWAEDLLDTANRTRTAQGQRVLARLANLLVLGAKWMGEDTNLEGSWHGNDTVWRTTLDLQRILRFGRTNGSLSSEPQRYVVSITDAIVGGEGEGPMSPLPVPSAFLTGAINSAAAEWVNARLMGFDPQRIPLTRAAFVDCQFPIVRFGPESIRAYLGGHRFTAAEIFPFDHRAFMPSKGWQGHCELDQSQ